MTPTMRRVAMLIGLAIVIVPMVLFTANNPFVPMNLFLFAVAAIVAAYGLWMLVLGGGFPTPVRVGMPSAALVILAAAWVGVINITASERVLAEEATAAFGFYTDEIIISADCRVVRPGTTGIFVAATPDELGRGCKVTVDTTKNDLYIPATGGALPDGTYAPDYRTYVFVSPATPQVNVFAYSSERFRSAQELPAWTRNHVVGTVGRTPVPRNS